MKKIFCKLLLFIYILFFSVIQLFSQNKLDSLKLILQNSTSDTSTIIIFIEIGDLYKDTIPDSSGLYYNKALELSKKTKDLKFKIKSYSSLASLNISLENYEKAAKFYEKEIELCKSINDKEDLKIAAGNSGVLYYYLGKYPKALTNLYILEKTAAELNDSAALATAYTNIGNIFKKLDENEKALSYFNKNLEISQKLNLETSTASAYNNIGLIYQTEKKDALAIDYFSKALEIFKQTGEKEGEAIANLNIGLSLDMLHQRTKVEHYFKRASALAEQIKSNRLIAESQYKLAELYFEFSNSEDYNNYEKKRYLTKAKEYANNAYIIAKLHNYMDTEQKITRILIYIYKKTGNLQKSLKYATEHIAIKDSMFNNENLEAIQKMNAKYEIYKNKTELEKKQAEVNQRNKLIESQKLIIRYGIISAVIFLILTFFIILQYFKVKKQKNTVCELKKLQDYFINNLPAYIYLKDTNFKYQLVNKIYSDLLGLPKEDIIGKSDRELEQETKYEDLDMKVVAMDKPLEPLTEKFITKEGKEIWVSIKKVPYHDLEGKVAGIIGIVSDVTEYTNLNYKLQKLLDKSREQTKIIEKANNRITDSLNYAKTIQDALVPKDNFLKTLFDNFFIINKGQQIVSGDFYYASKVKDTIIFALADCTGHGIPGGFLTMLSISFLNQIISEDEKIVPSEILEELKNKIIDIFSKSGQPNKNGLDISLCSLNTLTNVLQFSGAYNSLFLLRNNDLVEYKATRIPIGLYFAEKKFKNYKIQLQKNDIIYLFTDGFKDQIGGTENKKFSSKRLKNLIIKNKLLSFSEQKQIIEKVFDEWKGNNEQIDDVSMFVVKPHI